MATAIRTKRVYEEPEPSDGLRILVDRIWPRGLTKEKAAIDLWLKDAAPSKELRQWFGHLPERWPEFRRRYFRELEGEAAQAALETILTHRGAVTLVYAAKDDAHNNAEALREYLARR